ncbi:MAG: hypothetical protein QG604_636 [Candidatus Dependentiae bacterium]|nr:hypothetical protein [Candidatus Dependentiae bacterium]
MSASVVASDSQVIFKKHCDIWQQGLAAEYRSILADSPWVSKRERQEFEELYGFVIRASFTRYSRDDLGKASSVCEYAYRFEKRQFDRYIKNALGRDVLGVVLNKHAQYVRITKFVEQIERLLMFIADPELDMLRREYGEIVQRITTSRAGFATYYGFAMNPALRNFNYEQVDTCIALCEAAPKFVCDFLSHAEYNQNSVHRILYFNKRLLTYLYSLVPV